MSRYTKIELAELNREIESLKHQLRERERNLNCEVEHFDYDFCSDRC